MDIYSVTIPVPTVFIYVAAALVIILLAKFVIRFVLG